MANILAFESFDGGSHKQFRETVSSYSNHDWTWITRPAHSWKWRMVLSAQEMVEDAMRQGVQKPEAIFCTSLTDVAALRSFLPRGWRNTICKEHGWEPVGHRVVIYALSPEE